MRRHTRIGTAVLSAVALALAGCSGDDGDGGSDPNEKVTLSYAVWDQTQKPAMEELAKAINALPD